MRNSPRSERDFQGWGPAMTEHEWEVLRVSGMGANEEGLSPGQVVQRRRLALGMSVRALAAEAGVDRGTISDLEEGAGRARAATVAAILATLDRLDEAMSPEPTLASGERVTFDVHGPDGQVAFTVSGPVSSLPDLEASILRLVRGLSSGS